MTDREKKELIEAEETILHRKEVKTNGRNA